MAIADADNVVTCYQDMYNCSVAHVYADVVNKDIESCL